MDASQKLNGPLSSCCQHPELALFDSQLSTEVFYYETNDTPGICISHDDRSFGWSSVKINTAVKVGVDSSDGSDLNISECVALDFQSREGVPGFDIETAEDLFRAHRASKRFKSGQ